MRPPAERSWKGEDNTVKVTDDATPTAEAHLLIAADQAVMDAATTPYCGCAHLFEGGTTGLTDRYLGVRVAPGAAHGRVALANAYSTTATATTANTWWTNDGGVAGADINTVPSAVYRNRAFVPTALTTTELVESGSWINPAPAATSDRQGALQSVLFPTTEPCYVSQACGVSLYVSEQAADLEVL